MGALPAGLAYIFLTEFFLTLASNLSRKQCDDRRSMICEQIKNFVVVKEDDSASFVKQSDLLNLLNMAESDKSLLTRCVKVCFPNSTKQKNHENE